MTSPPQIKIVFLGFKPFQITHNSCMSQIHFEIFSAKNENVEIVDTYKYLGITISKDLSVSKHIINICSKLNQRPLFPSETEIF